METFKIILTRDIENEFQELPLRVILGSYAGLARSRAMALVAELVKVREVTIHGFTGDEAAQLVERIRPFGARCSIERDVCPVCGSNLTRVLSDWRVWLSPRQRALTVSGRAILGPDDGKPTPDCVCLPCFPVWREFHRLALQDDELQMAKEQAVADCDFDRALSIRDQQYVLRPQLEELLQRLRA